MSLIDLPPNLAFLEEARAARLELARRTEEKKDRERKINVMNSQQSIVSRKRIRSDGHVSQDTLKRVMWLHRILNHCPLATMAQTIRMGLWPDCEVSVEEVEQVMRCQDCITCMLTRAHRLSPTIGSGGIPPAIGHTISCDYVPVSTVARGGVTGYYLFRELRVGYLMAVLVTTKTQFLKSVLLVRGFFLQHEHTLKRLSVDAGAVENAAVTKTFLNTLGIEIQSAPPECQFQNPVERSQQTLANAVRAALGDQDSLDNSFWGLAVVHCTAVINAIPNKLSGDVSPMFAVTGRHPDFKRQFLFPFGQPVVCVNLKQEKKFKFASLGEFGFIVGIVDSPNGGVLAFLPGRSGNRIYIRRDVRPIRLSPFVPLTKAPREMFDANGVLVLPDNPRLNLPGIRFFETPEPTNTETNVPMEDELNYRDIITTPQVQLVVNADPALSPLYGLRAPTMNYATLQNKYPMRTLINESTSVSNSEGEELEPFKEVYDLHSKEDERDSDVELKPINEVDADKQIDNDRDGDEPMKSQLESVSTFGRIRNPNPKYINKVVAPRTADNPSLGEAMASKEWITHWLPATKKEFETLRSMGTWHNVEVDEKPPGASVFPTKIVYTKKICPTTGVVLVHKARLCVVGNALSEIYQNVFAPTNIDNKQKNGCDMILDIHRYIAMIIRIMGGRG